MRTFINTCGIVVIIVALISFAVRNAHPVEIRYYKEVAFFFPVWGIILFPFFAGVVVGNLLDVVQRFKMRNEIRKIKREFKEMHTGEAGIKKDQ